MENLLLIERASLSLGSGLTVLTGETGAGKTVLAHALDLLLGGRARSGIVRPGAQEAYVEGVFELSDELRGQLAERLAPDAQDLVLARRVGSDARTRAYVGGRSATVGELRDVAAPLLSFYGQHEHRKLTLASAQLDILDAYCGAEQGLRRRACAQAHAAICGLDSRLDDLRSNEGQRARELDLLVFELAEIESLAPQEGEDEALRSERDRLRHLEALRAGAGAALEAISPESGDGGAADILGGATRGLESVAGVDPALDLLAERLQALALEAGDLATDLRSYGSDMDAGPGRLEEVEERLAALDGVLRKHGGTVASVFAHAEEAAKRREELEQSDEALARAEVELEQALERRAQVAGELSKARELEAPLLAGAVRERLGDLAMPGADFQVFLDRREETGSAGADKVELVVAPNPGVPAGPLREIASGGELSRVMLALLAVANAGGSATLVFDEVDAGIGGQTARVVGEALRDLAAGSQILCITHLPQIASLAERHFRIEKDLSSDPARATVLELRDDAVVAELARMMGAGEGDSAAMRHAAELLRAA